MRALFALGYCGRSQASTSGSPLRGNGGPCVNSLSALLQDTQRLGESEKCALHPVQRNSPEPSRPQRQIKLRVAAQAAQQVHPHRPRSRGSPRWMGLPPTRTAKASPNA